MFKLYIDTFSYNKNYLQLIIKVFLFSDIFPGEEEKMTFYSAPDQKALRCSNEEVLKTRTFGLKAQT